MSSMTTQRLPLIRFLLTCVCVMTLSVVLTPVASAQGEHGEETTHAQPENHGESTPAHAEPGHQEESGHNDEHAASGHDEHGAASPIAKPKEAMWTAITALIAFGVVFFVFATKIWPKIEKGLSDRESKFRDEIKAAENARIQAKEALVEYEKSLAEARAEAKQMLEETRAQQATYAAELKAKADQELAAMKDKARRDIDSARRAAVADIYNEASTLATKIAGKILQRELSAADHQRLVDESLAELQSISRTN
ncbi:MAG: F0F1 ATP synthase subunit B [Phycisphaeraceae bacterium]|nr:F0F1 ATP synthase subunit B [Phycisphaerales bacterium]MCB9861296.1 F0F1 ATP synthase subunit B [Phycisphaeraceae bacterium]